MEGLEEVEKLLKTYEPAHIITLVSAVWLHNEGLDTGKIFIPVLLQDIRKKHKVRNLSDVLDYLTCLKTDHPQKYKSNV